jgi:two-component system nitrogen regulation sensor histidine kinase NtrY
MKRWWARLAHDRRVLALILAGGMGPVVVALALLWLTPHETKVATTLTTFVLLTYAGFAFAARAELVAPLHTLANLLAAVREGDFSMRSARAGDDALGTVMLEVNTLSTTLRAQRLGAVEASNLLWQVMEEIDVAVLAFDDEGVLRLSNPAADRLLDVRRERGVGKDADELGVGDLLTGPAPRTLLREFPGGRGPWEMRRTRFRQGGKPHELIVLADLRRALREEEQQAWRRLVRVLGHEINNSLAPIQSIAQNLSDMAGRPKKPEGWEEDVQRGLAVVGRRAEALGRFLASYTRLARLPPPRFTNVDVGACVARVADLEKRLPISVSPGAPTVISADSDQLEQLLINLVRNATEASLEVGGKQVGVAWRRDGSCLEIDVVDDGPGLAATENLFVLFFTTKPQGTGIGLVLSRQIAESHGGSLTLENRPDGRGCVARLKLPLPSPPPATPSYP